MHIVHSISELRAVLTPLGRPGFVPTMGNLHLGHASLMSAAHLHGRRVISSIFVNPIQFNRREDLTAYPRQVAHDCEAEQRELEGFVGSVLQGFGEAPRNPLRPEILGNALIRSICLLYTSPRPRDRTRPRMPPFA